IRTERKPGHCDITGAEHALRAPGCRIPQPDGAVVSARSEQLPIPRPGHGAHGARVTRKGPHLLAGLDIPDPDQAVRTGGCKELSIWVERQAVDGSRRADDRAGGTSADGPKVDLLPAAAACQELPTGS